jgi:hypothetical protein
MLRARHLVPPLVAAAGLGCSSTQVDGRSACPADVAGDYAVTSARIEGTCELSDPEEVTLTIRRAEDGTYLAAVPGAGAGCPGAVDPATCRFTSRCELEGHGLKLGEVSLDYTFTVAGFSGTSRTSLVPPAAVRACVVAYRETATKR